MFKPLARIGAALKAFSMSWGRQSWPGSWGGAWLAVTKLNIAGTVGDGTHNSIVLACTRWVTRTWPEAPIVVRQRGAKGKLEVINDHPLTDLLERPNPHYSGVQMLTATLADRLWTGNAYWLKIRSGSGRPVELWWVPSALMKPVWPDNDPTVFISHYEYSPNGTPEPIPVEDVIHFRVGFDPKNVRLGRSDLADLLGEIFTDEESSRYVSTMLANLGVPGVVISPDDKDAQPSQEDLDDIKAKFMQRFGGDQRGQPLVMKGPTRVSILSFSPEQMKVRELRRIPEERVSAVLGIPAIVVGLGAGLDRSTYSNMAEAREAAYEGHIIPDQRLFAADLQQQLVPEFGDPQKIRIGFDYTQVRVLQDDQNALHERARADLGAGLLTLNQALQMIGADPVEGEAGDVRYIPNTVTVKTLDTLIPEEQPAALPEPTPLRALPAPAEDEAAAGKGVLPAATKAADLSDADLLARFDAGLSTLSEDLADDLMSEFEELVDVALARYRPAAKDNQRDDTLEAKAEGDVIDGLVTLDDHDQIKRLLRSYILKSARQAAEDLAPLTGGAPMRIQRNTPAVKAAIQAMESRLPGIAETTGSDFGRLIRRLERRPGSVSLDEVRSALLTYVEETYPGRAATIARTELGYGHQAGSLHVIEKAGLADRVRIHDGDDDPACRARNGTTATIEEARGIGLLHPNCRLAVTPLLAEAS